MFDFYKGKRHHTGLMQAYNPSDNTKGREYLNTVMMPRFAKRLKDGDLVYNIGKHVDWDYSLVFNNFELRCDYRTTDNQPDNIPDIVDDITESKLESDSADAIIYVGMSNIGIDNNKAFEEIYRILKPGGLFLVSLDEKVFIPDKFIKDEVHYIYEPTRDGWDKMYSDGGLNSSFIICRKPI